MATFRFGPIALSSQQVFHISKLSFSFVNLKPLVPGHVLVAPRRVVERLKDLSDEETADLFLCVRTVSTLVEKEYAGESLTVAVQDGPYSGQTIPHVHVHIIPRGRTDPFAKDNDRVYSAIEKNEKDLEKGYYERGGLPGNLEVERKPRTEEDMAREATRLRQLFSGENGPSEGERESG
ncbi:ATPase-like protein [Cladochytrium replicatum]|nr:ATPase-like protein [Cladochytrium replicatum]